MQIQKIGIIGLGAVGVMYGEMLTRAFGRERVFFVADGARVQRYAAEPPTLNGAPCDFRYVADDNAAGETADLMLFIVKYTGLTQAIESARLFIRPDTVLVSALNGVKSEGDLAAAFGDAHLLYCAVQGMDATKRGRAVTCTTTGYFALGLKQGGENDDLRAVCAALDRAGIAHREPPDITHHIWSKCMLNVGCNQVTAARGMTYGGIQAPGEAREEMIAAMREAQAVARCEGVVLTDQEIDQWLALMDTLSPDGMTSMRQDTLAGRPTEVELFAGTVCTLGKKHGVQTPVNDSLYGRIKALETGV